MTRSDETAGDFLRHVGAGRIDDVRAMLDDEPALVNAVGPHPFWGGRPQPLHVAIETTRGDMIRLLLERGADVDGSNNAYDAWSPLMLAINRKLHDVQRELLRRGATRGLLESLMLGDDERVSELLDSDGLPALSPNRGSVLAFARTPFAIDRLLALGAPADTKDRWGATPIEAMSRMGPDGAALVRHMAAKGISAGPAELARIGDLAALQRLVAADPSIAAQDAVMMAAVDFGHHAIVEWLLARGGNVSAHSDAESRHTALHSAAWNGNLAMVELLVGAGADASARDAQYDATPAGWAETSITVTNNPRCAEVVEYLRPRTA